MTTAAATYTAATVQQARGLVGFPKDSVARRAVMKDGVLYTYFAEGTTQEEEEEEIERLNAPDVLYGDEADQLE